ncbi:MAG: sugar transporter [Desulfuromonas sp.]|nr:MAG: sugar transporter [Desulfuromonas sp.]
MQSVLALLGLFVGLALAGCTHLNDLPVGSVIPLESSAVVESEAVVVAPFSPNQTPGNDYRIGAGDVLYVNVQGKPELGSPSGNGQGVSGSRVDGKGNIHLPLVGAVSVAGLTVDAAATAVQAAFSTYLNAPWVVLEVEEYKSQPLYLLGQFRAAGTYYMERPLTLLQGIALGGGLLDSANLRRARLIRGDKTLAVDVYEMLTSGGMLANVWLLPGDTLFVPDDNDQNVFVFGAVNKPGVVHMPNGNLTLTQALAAALPNETRGDFGLIRIIRSHSATRGELMVVDMNQVLKGRTLPFRLAEGDIVYVPRSGIGSWNEALAEILPSLQTFSAILQPFVQVKFLTED